MRLNVSTVATAAFAVCFMPAFNVCAGQSVESSAGPNSVLVADSPVAAGGSSSSAEAAPLAAEPTPAAAATTGGRDFTAPRFELFLGYSYIRGFGTADGKNRIAWLNGGSAALAFRLSRSFALVGDVGGFNDTKLKLRGTGGAGDVVVDSSGTAYTFLVGPRVYLGSHERITPFVQALFGGAHVSAVTLSNCAGNACTYLPADTNFAMTAGGGLDVKIHRHIAIRGQGEYLMTRFGDLNTGKSATQNDLRLSTGLVFRFGGHSAPPPPPLPALAYSCSVNPSTAYPGDTIAVSGTALNLNPAKTAAYTWVADGGVVTGSMGDAKIDTSNVAVGSYTLKGHVSDGERPQDNADCSATYAIKNYEPPTVSCAADPSSVVSSGSTTITATGVSPQNRPLTYSFTSSAGSLSGSGSMTALATAGAPVGTIKVTCNVSDDKGQTASSTTSVTVAAPVAAVAAATSAMCSISFERDHRRPARVDNEAKACLDQIALTLQSTPDATLAIVANASHTEKNGRKLTSERALNTKAYLVRDKGIDASRIMVYTGSQDGAKTSDTLVPAGATFDSMGDTRVDETAHPVVKH